MFLDSPARLKGCDVKIIIGWMSLSGKHYAILNNIFLYREINKL